MAKIRPRRLGDEIHRHLAGIIDQKIKDPRKGIITITGVKMSPDLSLATVNFTSVDNEGNPNPKEGLAVLEHAAGFLRRELAAEIHVRIVPQLRFFYDDSLDKLGHIEELIRGIHDDEGSDSTK